MEALRHYKQKNIKDKKVLIAEKSDQQSGPFIEHLAQFIVSA